MKINAFISRNLGIILLVSALSGLFIQPGNFDSSTIIVLALAAIIFASFFQIQLNIELLTRDLKASLIFFVSRFIVIPIIVYYAVSPFSFFYAACFLVMFLLPSAVSAPAFTSMFRGTTPLSLKLLVMTSFLSIITIPVIIQMVLDRVDIAGNRVTAAMMYTIVAPFILHLPFRRSSKTRKAVADNIPLITAIGLAVIFIISTSKNRDLILSNPIMMLIYGLISIVMYMALYAIGYYMMYRKTAPDRIAYSVCSGANNIGLGVALTALFFPSSVNVFFIVAQLAWIFILIPARRIFYRAVIPVSE